jgi:3-deoxy-7-phosphoheptulonate synthase
MIILLFCLLNLGNCLEWSKTSWRSKIIKQIPTYPDLYELKKVENQLSNYSPIIFAGEADELTHNLAKINIGDGFLLIGGDCAEMFDEFSVNKIRDLYKLILQMSLIISYGGSKSVIKVGRVAGQFAKPRTEEFETINGSKVLTYRGDIINDVNDRLPNPNRMLDAYHQSTQTLNIIRAFSSGGFANLNDVNVWNSKFVNKTSEGSDYRELIKKIEENLKFMKILGIDLNDAKFKQINFYTAHECLLLNYEEALTRIDSRTNKIYDCSGHLLWLGERTRDLDGAHVEFLRGINNPIGIKVSHKVNIDDLLYLVKLLNPNNTSGKIIIMTRMGYKNLREKLPDIIRAFQNEAINVVWCCDPMHGNTIQTDTNVKTRLVDSIKEEIKTFFEIHKKCGTTPGGIHLEMSADNVTECLGGDIISINENDLKKNYLSKCDPRLNPEQSLEIAFLIAKLLKSF